MPTSEEAAVAAAQAAVAAPETASGSETETQTETETEIEFPSFNIDLPADLRAELEEEETDTTVSEEELDTLAEENEDVPREVLARMRAAEKRAEHLEGLRVKEARKNWSEEAEKFFPLASPFLGDINATSRRGFLRTAKEVHEKMVPIVEEKVLAPARKAIQDEKVKAKTEGKEEARQAWGQAGESQTAPSEATATLQATERRRGRGELSDVIRGMMFPKGD